jgi:hypothetical protein
VILAFDVTSEAGGAQASAQEMGGGNCKRKCWVLGSACAALVAAVLAVVLGFVCEK